MFPSNSNIKSVIEYLILLAIKKEERVLRPDLLKILRVEFRDAWIPKAGTVHPILERLENRGLIHKVEVGEETPKRYEITENGKQVLNDTFEYFEKITAFNDKILIYGAEQFDHLTLLDLLIKRLENIQLLINNREFTGANDPVKERLSRIKGLIVAQLEVVEEKIKQSDEQEGFVEVKIN